VRARAEAKRIEEELALKVKVEAQRRADEQRRMEEAQRQRDEERRREEEAKREKEAEWKRREASGVDKTPAWERWPTHE
jgi:colicin import membrane protein